MCFNGCLYESWTEHDKAWIDSYMYSRTCIKRHRTKRGHPLLSGHVAKSRKFHNINTIYLTFIKWSPLLSARGHLFHCPKLNFSLFQTLLNGQCKVTTANIIQYIIKSLFGNISNSLRPVLYVEFWSRRMQLRQWIVLHELYLWIYYSIWVNC